ncbi:hypothetical protein BU24DRAFT_363044 [Aaosphaeria arxii CBS 175.79]|uniref:Tyrosine--tRNA ligase n=1 Tax=Aaosphaeria arxii CBS 175.79 TaxID=1450172 RepID=A0A6A5YBG0_9PLEO|nr:uncharacterized protein BU24DRAFT_363044 [Aaosphaeria arxii CBS 175.79]KAF2022041.1 hypothetical protein BU24DRAFT_363044 [Aaosphaeria arxii CBS 175.79]
MITTTLFRRIPNSRACIPQRCVRNQLGSNQVRRHTSSSWANRTEEIKSGREQSMLAILEERGFVKDVAGGRKALDWLLTEKPIGAYVGVDPTAPSLHVGHLLPLMALYWMYLHGFYAVTLLGNGTVKIGDPSGRTTARSRQSEEIHRLNIASIHTQLKQLWVHVNALGAKHRPATEVVRRKDILTNDTWLSKLSAVDLMRGLGSGMRLGTMLNRDSVKMRMENGDGMAISEFSYPLFQGYDWWHMYANNGVQMQLGGSDQYGNICAGMDAIGHMRSITYEDTHSTREDDLLKGAFGLTTPLLTTASGEKFGKSAGNAVWLDKDMLSSFDLYQYFLRTADDDVERYLKLFTFIPVDSISAVMSQQTRDASRRLAQHLLAKEVVELAHGAAAARQAEISHKETFSHGTNVFSLGALRHALNGAANFMTTMPKSTNKQSPEKDSLEQSILKYKKEYASTPTSSNSTASVDSSKEDRSTDNYITLPKSLLSPGSFPQVLHAAGLVSSKSEGHRLIKSKGAYVVQPNSGSPGDPYALKWVAIRDNVPSTDPNHYLIDYEALVLRSGKSKVQICRIVDDDQSAPKA